MAKFDIKDKAFRNLIEERDKFYGLKSDEFQKLNNAVDQYKKSNFFAKLFNVGDAKKAQKEFEELKENKYFKQVLTNYGFEFDSKGDIQKAEWYANQTKQGVPDVTVLEQPSLSQLSRSDDRSIGQYAQLPPQQLPAQPSVSIGQYAQSPSQPSNEQYGQVPPPPQQELGGHLHKIPSTEELARIAKQHLANESYSFENPHKANKIYTAGAVPPTSQYGTTPTPVRDIYAVPAMPESPGAPSNRPKSQFPQQGGAGLQQPNETIFKSSIDVEKYKGDDPKKFFSSGVDTGEYASTNQALFNRGQAEMSENLAQQRAASAPPQQATAPMPSSLTKSAPPALPPRASATAGLANSAPPKIHQTPVSPDIRATYQPFVSESNQQYAGASSAQPPAAKRQLPTPPATNVVPPKSPSIAERQAALFGGAAAAVTARRASDATKTQQR
jgi:hypothetical protein